jgi:anti-anti-sigma factor
MATTPEVSAPVRYLGSIAVVDLPPQIDSTAERALDQAYRAAAEHGTKTVLLNFGGVAFLSSTGIALVVGILARARKEGRTIIAAGLSDHYREIFEITRLSDFMRIYADERTALTDADGGKR